MLIVGLAYNGVSLAGQVSVHSPDGNIKLSVTDETYLPSYKIEFMGKSVINSSQLGLVFKDSLYLDDAFNITSSSVTQINTTWQQPWGERKVVQDHHQELEVNFQANREQVNTYTLRVRVFNDGVAFRYEVPQQNGLTKQVYITNELTEFNITEFAESTAYWIPSRGWNRYEYVYNTTDLTDVSLAHTPFTFKSKSGVHMSIHEAALVDYAGMSLNQRRPGVLKADLAPWSDGILVKTKPGFKTPWRTIQISDDAVGLLNSDIIINLNEANKLGDVSWVEPGKYVGIWWGMHVNETTWGSGDKHGATTPEVKRYMDFAAKYGFSGVLVEGWNIGWDGNWFFNGDVFQFDQSYPDFDLEKISQYGKKVGVDLIGHHETSGNVTNYRNQMQDAYDLYQKHGVKQVKTGYVADGGNIKRIDENGVVRHEWHDGQFMVNEYLHSVTEAAKRGISINTHEPIKDTGLRRTYPNWITREGARGQEFNAWGNPPNPPEHAALLPFTRFLAGPMDFTPGIFNMGFNGLDANSNRPQTTLAKQLALYVVFYSPIQMAADLPRNYEAKPDAFQFILDVTTDWEQSIALAGEIGEYVAFARQGRDSEDWFVGALTDENSRQLTLDFDFLTLGKRYQAQIYRDGKKADWIDNPYDIIIEEKTIVKGDKITLPLATSGGAAIYLKAVK